MGKYQYRITEKNGSFTIQAFVLETKGILWWKKKIETWRAVDHNGVPCVYFNMGGLVIDTYKIKLRAFDNIEDAEKKIKEFTWPDIKYHYPFGKPDGLPHFESCPPPPNPKTV